MSITKIRVLGHAGKGIYQDFPPNQNLLLLIDTQFWRQAVTETGAGGHYLPPVLSSVTDMAESQCGNVVIHWGEPGILQGLVVKGNPILTNHKHYPV